MRVKNRRRRKKNNREKLVKSHKTFDPKSHYFHQIKHHYRIFSCHSLSRLVRNERTNECVIIEFKRRWQQKLKVVNELRL